MGKFSNILFIDTSNTIRSVMAELIMKDMLKRAGKDDIEVKSRGLVVLFPEPINPKVSLIVKNHGINFNEEEKHSSQLIMEDLEKADLIITVNVDQKLKVLEEFSQDLQIYTLAEYTNGNKDAEDPYGKDVIDYEKCFIQIEKLIRKICNVIVEYTD